VPVVICFAKKLQEGFYNEKTFQIDYVQLSKRMTFSCLKKRIVDCLIKVGEAEADVEHIRLWLC
jgi:hypothetical protein